MKLYADGPTLEEIEILDSDVNGYTFNPSLFRKLGATDYLEFSKKNLKKNTIKTNINRSNWRHS